MAATTSFRARRWSANVEGVSREPQEKSGGLSLQTLLISSLSAVAAAIVVPMFWAKGSLIATAFTPIIVALVSEALNRPAKVITQVTPRVTRRSGTGAAVRSRQPTGVGARGEGPERVSRWGREDDPFGLQGGSQPPRRRSPVRLAVITGLLAAVIGAAVVTASELAIFGHQIGDSNRSTGLLGGKADKAEATPTATPDATEDATATPEATASPAPTEAASPTPSASPTASETPPAVAPPTEATPAPTATP